MVSKCRRQRSGLHYIIFGHQIGVNHRFIKSRDFCHEFWWHLVGGLVAIFYFPIYWVANHPNWLSYFSEGFKPPTRWILMTYLHGNLTIDGKFSPAIVSYGNINMSAGKGFQQKCCEEPPNECGKTQWFKKKLQNWRFISLTGAKHREGNGMSVTKTSFFGYGSFSEFPGLSHKQKKKAGGELETVSLILMDWYQGAGRTFRVLRSLGVVFGWNIWNRLP